MSSFIIPAGSKKFDLFPGVQKVAADNKDALLSDDVALDAIKDLPGLKEKANELLDTIKEKVQEISDEVKEKVEEIAVDTKEEEEEEDKGEEVKEEEKEDKGDEVKEEEKEDKGDEVKEEEKEEVVDEVEIDIGDEVKEDEKEEVVDEVEIDIGDEVKEDEKEDEIDDMVGPEDIVKRSKESCVAGNSNGFVRIAKLSPKNKTTLRTYWLGLGFPKEYVDAMIKDY